MRSIFFGIFILSLIPTYSFSEISKNIINNLINTENYTFKFSQKIDDEEETGICTIVFNGKINCIYDKSEKTIISNGNILVVKNKISSNPSFYKLKETVFYNLLDKNFLIKLLKDKDMQSGGGNNFLEYNKNDINIVVFFDKKSSFLKGWQTTDIYNNVVSTYIFLESINEKISKDLFNISSLN